MIEGEVQKKTLKRNIKDFKEQKYDPNLEEFGRKKNRNKKIQKKVKKWLCFKYLFINKIFDKFLINF